MRILFVCLGNICRSPTAEAAVRESLEEAGLGDRVHVDSAGTGSWHLGEPPDRRMTATAARDGLRLDGQARRFAREDFERFDLILAMDHTNRHEILMHARDEDDRAKVRMFRDFDPEGEGEDVPDPYFGGDEGFREVVAMARRTARGLTKHLAEQLG